MNPPDPRARPVARATPESPAGLRRWWMATNATLSLTGLVVLLACVGVVTQPEWRKTAEEKVLNWLLSRQESTPALRDSVAAETTGIERTQTAKTVSPSELPQAQAAVALWLSRRYRVASEPLSVLVAEAFQIGSKLQLDPTLLLAVMAIESRFNPYAQSPMGAQGLMQVLTRVHTDKYESFGGALAAFDPVSNLRVGAQVLHDAVRKAGSIEGGLRLYVGAVSTDGSAYINKVMAEHLRLKSVVLGQPMPTVFPLYVPPKSIGESLPSPPSATHPPVDHALEAEAGPSTLPAAETTPHPG